MILRVAFLTTYLLEAKGAQDDFLQPEYQNYSKTKKVQARTTKY
jgi:hypothetical protein